MSHLKKLLLFVLVLMLNQTLFAQQQITISDIWASRKFMPKMVYGINPMQHGSHYAVIEENKINVYDYQTGEQLHTLVNLEELVPENEKDPIAVGSYNLSSDETKLLIPTATESIYRHSSRSEYYYYDLNTKILRRLSKNGKQQLADFSPDGTMIAFARENNVFVYDIATDTEKQITSDGKTNEIIYGTTDWVYEEEFSFTKAFFWSPDSKRIAFYRFDESNVKEFQLEYFGELYPEWYRYKYPKAGEDNSLVSIHVYDIVNSSTNMMDIGAETDIYIPRIKWTANPEVLSIQRLNRLQNHFEILLANVSSGETTVLYKEENPYYIDINDHLNFLPGNELFLLSSEKDGFNHLYLYNLKGEEVKQLTSGNWDVTEVFGYDPRKKMVYFQSAETSPLDRQIFSVSLKGKKTQLTSTPGTNNASFSTDFSYFINTNTTANSPHTFTVNNNDGKVLRILDDNSKLKETLAQFSLSKKEFFTISDSAIKLPNGENVSLNAWKILPPHFDAAKKYPVLLYVYGGPGSQTVVNSWGYYDYFWFEMLAQQGFIVVSVDNRGTGARGELFKKMTYKELGKYETEDMITTARFLGTLPYVDKAKIGIFGWSYGGFMASSAITKGADYFNTAIAVAPVTSWRYYDNIYTERFMQLPNENALGYDDNSPINHVSKLKGNFLLVHGSADDNVHYQNSMDLISALVAADKQFDLMIYPNKNHGIYGGNTRKHLYEKMTSFLLKHLSDNK